MQVESLVKEVAAHEDKVEGLRKEVRRHAREASQMEKKVSQFIPLYSLNNKSFVLIDNNSCLRSKITNTNQ